MSRISQEFYCGECDSYFIVRLNMAINYEVQIQCPNDKCNHLHRRCVVDGIIYERGRFVTDHKEQILPNPATLSKKPITDKMKQTSYKRDGVPIDFRDNWLEVASNEREANMSKTIEISPINGSNLALTLEVPDELQVLEGIEEPSLGSFVFRIIDALHGDKRITWDSRSLLEIQAAKKMFLNLIKEGFTPYKVGVNGNKTSEVMKEFDAKAEEIIFLPTKLVAGG